MLRDIRSSSCIQCRVPFPGSTGDSCSINKSIFSPIRKAISYKIDLPFFVHLRRVRSSTAILCHAFEISGLDFPLIETSREAIRDSRERQLRKFSLLTIDSDAYERERIHLALYLESLLSSLFTEIKQRSKKRSLGERLTGGKIAGCLFRETHVRLLSISK